MSLKKADFARLHGDYFKIRVVLLSNIGVKKGDLSNNKTLGSEPVPPFAAAMELLSSQAVVVSQKKM